MSIMPSHPKQDLSLEDQIEEIAKAIHLKVTPAELETKLKENLRLRTLIKQAMLEIISDPEPEDLKEAIDSYIESLLEKF